MKKKDIGLYDYVLNNSHIFNFEVLLNLGYTYEDIDDFSYRGIISSIGDGLYRFENADEMFYIGKRHLENDNYEECKRYLKKALLIDPDHLDSWNLLLTKSISYEDYEEVFKLFDMVPEIEIKYHKRDCDFCLYLLSFITKLPDKYRNYIKFLKQEDLILGVNDTRFENRVWQNRIRSLTMQRKFRTALKEQKESIDSSEYPTVQEMIYRDILKKIVKVDDKFHENIIDSIKNKEFDKVVKLLIKRDEECGLGSYDIFSLKVAQAIEEIIKYGVLPQKLPMRTDNVFDAISANNYEIALMMNRRYIEENDFDGNKNILHMLLEEVCSVINDVKSRIGEKQNSKMSEDNSNEDFCTSSSKEELVSKYYEILKKKGGIILLEPMSKAERTEIHSLVKQNNEIMSFSMGTGPIKRVVIRRSPKYLPGVNLKEEYKIAEELYRSRQFDKCEEKFLEILDLLKFPDSYIFARLAFTYLEKQDLVKALDYFEIADFMAKKKKSKYDYTSIIRRIKNTNLEKEKDVDVILEENDFDNYYEITNFNEINDLINLTGMDLESACQKFGLTEERIDTVRLLYAREYFIQKLPEKGDEFLRQFEKSEHKTSENLKLLREIRNNKCLYVNKGSQNGKKLLLTMKP